MIRDGAAYRARLPGAATEDASDRWEQHAAFSIFFDTRPGLPGELRWRTRLYHDESADEVTLSGTEPTGWVRWMLGRLGSAQPLSEPVDALVGIEIIDVRLTGSPGGGDATVELQLQVTGLDGLHRALGARVLGVLFGPGLE